MIFLKEKVKYRLEDFHDVYNVVIKLHNGGLHPLTRITVDDMDKLHKNMKDGLPSTYSVVDDGIRIFPRPDKEYGVQITLVPPLKQV